MSFSITNKKITLTRGDTLKARIQINDPDGNPYTPNDGDQIRFAMKSDYTDKNPIIVKDVPIETMLLILNPEDTKELNFGKYVYDIQLTTYSGDVNTFIPKGTLILTEEVY